MQTTIKKKAPIAARVTRGLGTFNIVYGSLGLASAALIHFVFPPEMQTLSSGTMAASSLACVWIISQGLLLRKYGPGVVSGIPSAVRRLVARMRGRSQPSA